MISGRFASSFFIIFVYEYNKKLDPVGVFVLFMDVKTSINKIGSFASSFFIIFVYEYNKKLKYNFYYLLF